MAPASVRAPPQPEAAAASWRQVGRSGGGGWRTCSGRSGTSRALLPGARRSSEQLLRSSVLSASVASLHGEKALHVRDAAAPA